MDYHIVKISRNKKQYLDLLLLGDEQEIMIDRYLERGDLFVLEDNGIKAVCVVTKEGPKICELKNIAVTPSAQRQGYGRKLINYLINHYSKEYTQMMVGTGDVPGTLAFYKSCGFEYSHCIKDFFTENYDHPNSVVPFTYLAEKYKDDVAMIWIDAHPDITLPGDMYSGFHAMAVTACMGKGDKEILSKLPAQIAPSKILLVGLRDWERDEIKVRQKQYGIKHLTPEDVAQNSNAIYEWLKSCGASRVLIHFDMDVLDPAEIIAAVGVVPDGMKLAEVVRVINDIAKEKEIVGLTVAEPMPRIAIRIKEMLNQLPLLK